MRPLSVTLDLPHNTSGARKAEKLVSCDRTYVKLDCQFVNEENVSFSDSFQGLGAFAMMVMGGAVAVAEGE